MTAPRKLRWFKWLLALFFGGFVLHYAGRVFVFDRFGIAGVSMEPTLNTGQKVWVNKILMGPRIYTKFCFSDGGLKCVRLPGARKLRVGDVAVFNYPYGWGGDSVAFKINFVYCKRCWGAPGDTVWIKDCRLVSGGRSLDCHDQEQNPVKFMDFLAVALPDKISVQAGFFAGEAEKWTLRDFGPIVVPKRGMTIALDSVALRHYSRVIDWEHRCEKSVSGAVLGDSYTFQQDWCFFVGDNYMNSVDSRHFGFVPMDFVVGIVLDK